MFTFGAMAGTVDLILRCFAGLEIRDDVLKLHPSLPSHVLTRPSKSSTAAG